MRDRVLYRLLNTYKIQLSIGRDNVPQLQVLNPPSLTGIWVDGEKCQMRIIHLEPFENLVE
jgi:hypothetical protein